MFNKDILIVDLETTGLDSSKHEIVQIGAVLLDKKTLKEKGFFSSYVRPTKWKQRSLVSMRYNFVTWDLVKSAPTLKQALISFKNLFKINQLIIGNYGPILDIEFLKVGFTKIGKKYPFEYHVFNVWPLCYSYAAKHKLLKNKKRYTGFSLEDLAKHFKITIENHHDALADSRIEAEILRKIIKNS